MKQTFLNVKVSCGDSFIDGLCVEKCSPMHLNAILALCKPSYHVDIDFVSSDVDIPSGDMTQN